MTLFQELYALGKTATLTMIVSADEGSGKMTISVLPKPRKDVNEIALTKDLTLTATPEEFDEGFISALQNYREVRTSLTAQAEATQKVLEAAKSASVKKASDAIAKAKNSATKSPASPAATVKGDQDAESKADNAAATEAESTSGETMSLFG